MVAFVSFLCGLAFGWGLLISGMVQPAKVLGFLDVLGPWDPTLAFVMVGALIVTSIGFAYTRRRAKPILAAQSLWPTRTNVDGPLIIGSVLFGAGWGLVGLCPGPALENLATLSPRVILFVIAMGLGMVVHELLQRRAHAPTRPVEVVLATGSDG